MRWAAGLYVNYFVVCWYFLGGYIVCSMGLSGWMFMSAIKPIRLARQNTRRGESISSEGNLTIMQMKTLRNIMLY